MNTKLTFFLIFAIPFLCTAQNPLPREYQYDAAGNRVVRKVLTMQLAPPAPNDSTENSTLNSQFSILNYFVETLAQTQIKIFPNPTTEKITMEISNLQNLQTGVFKLYNLNGQLLQERPVRSVSTEVSLAGLPAGTYILKVFINDKTEDWKIVKQ